jgi:hypothetical protein
MARKKRTRLVRGHLEGILSRVFDSYHDEITELTGKSHGVYALYKKGRLYYVGLARNLRRRVKQHLKDKHAKKWDSFNLYLIRNVNYLKELESLIVHISEPRGNIRRGRFARSENLIHRLEHLMELRDERQRDEILKGFPNRTGKDRRIKARKKDQPPPTSRRSALEKLLPTGTLLKSKYKKQEFTAEVEINGRIKIGNQLFNSPSSAGSFVRGGKATDGWTFWKYHNESGHWVKIDELRRKA